MQKHRADSFGTSELPVKGVSMEQYHALAHRAGCIRKKYKLTPYEAACCVLWLLGVEEEKVDVLAELMQELRIAKKGY